MMTPHTAIDLLRLPPTQASRTSQAPHAGVHWPRLEWFHPMPDDAQNPSTAGMSVLRLTFPVQTVLAIIMATLAVSGGVYASQYSMRSDLRDLSTQMTMQRQIDEATRAVDEERTKAAELSMAAMRASLDAMQRRQELQQYEIQSIKEVVMAFQEAQ